MCIAYHHQPQSHDWMYIAKSKLNKTMGPYEHDMDWHLTYGYGFCQYPSPLSSGQGTWTSAVWYFVSMTFSPKSSPTSPTVSMYSSLTPCCRVSVILCFLQPISSALPCSCLSVCFVLVQAGAHVPVVSATSGMKESPCCWQRDAVSRWDIFTAE